MAMMDERQQQQQRRQCTRCFRWNFLVSNVALGIIVLILAQLALPSLAFVVLKRPSFDPGQRSEDDEKEDNNLRRSTPPQDDDDNGQNRRLEDDDNDEPKIQNIDLDLLRQHLIQSLGLHDVIDQVPQITVSREEMARSIEEFSQRSIKNERRHKRESPLAIETQNSPKNNRAESEEEEEQMYTYITHGVPTLSGGVSAQKINFRLGNLTRVLRVGQRTMTSRIVSAKLYLHKPKVLDCPATYLYKHNLEQSGFSLVKQLTNRTTSNVGEIDIDVTDSVRRWVRFSHRKPLFLLSCDKLDASSTVFDTTTSFTRPIKARLEVRTRGVSSVNGRRDKRYTHYGVKFPFKEEEVSSCTNKEHSCCRKSVTITMEDLKLNQWVVQPKSFKFYYCKGKCRSATNQDNLYALIQQYLHQHGKHKKKLPKLCCTASKLSELEVLHLKLNPVTNTSEIKVSKWKNIIVDRCDCS